MWTPDGRYLIFSASPSQEPTEPKGYMIVPVEGGEAKPIGIWASLDEEVQFPRAFGSLRINPNGRQLVYVARSGPGRPGQVQKTEVWALEKLLPKAAK